MTTTRLRPVLGASVAALLLSLSACGDDTGDSGGASGQGSDTPEAAYAAFAQAVTDGDQDAFDAAVHDGYWSDLQGGQGDNAANLALHHWQVENDVVVLSDEPGEVLIGQDMLGEDAEADIEEYAALIAEQLELDDVSGDDLAIAKVTEGYDVGRSNAAAEAGCVEDDQPIDECLDEVPGDGDRAVLEVILVRGDDGWKVFGTEY